MHRRRERLEASVDEAVAAVALAVDGHWDGIDTAGSPPAALDRDRVARLADLLDRDLGAVMTDPYLLGAVHEIGLSSSVRRGHGVHFTPDSVCRGLVERAIDGWPFPRSGGLRVLDPACGGGAFLLAARSVLGTRTEVSGADRDPGAVWCARLALRRDPLGVDVVAADPIGAPDSIPTGYDLIVGNPPFLTQRRTATARDGASRSAVRDRFGDILGPYADGALVFLLDALERVAPGGRVAMILPWSIVASRDARRLRERLAPDLRHLWIGGPDVFPGAIVHVCAVVVEREPGEAPGPAIDRSSGPAFTPRSPRERPAGGEWGELLADALGFPDVSDELRRRWDRGPKLGERAVVTAGFRDEFYAISGAVSEAAGDASDELRVVSVGMIDALSLRWGERRVKIGGRSFLEPVVSASDVAGSETRVGRWLDARLRPKVLVATQTKVIEAVVDESGRMVPLTPTVSVEPQDPAELWHIAAALTGPVATVLAGRRTAGTALARGAIKVAAADLRALPLPTDAAAWDDAAAKARSVAAHPTPQGWKALAEAHMLAFGPVDDALVAWWLERLGVAPDDAAPPGDETAVPHGGKKRP